MNEDNEHLNDIWINPPMTNETIAKAGLLEIPTEGRYFTRKELRAAINEGRRLGFSRTMWLPVGLANFRWPINHAFKHTACDGLQNVRVIFYLWQHAPDDPALQDEIPEMCILDITPDRWAGLPA